MYGRNQCNKTNTFEILTFDSSSKGIEYRALRARWIIHQTLREISYTKREEEGGRTDPQFSNRERAERTNERIRMNTCRTMDWLARARNDFIIYLGHDRFQCANRNCLLRRSGVVNVASSSSRREWQFVSPIKLIASVRDWSRCSDRATSLTKGVAWSSLILEKDDGSSSIGSSIGEGRRRLDSTRSISILSSSNYTIISRSIRLIFVVGSLKRGVRTTAGGTLYPEISGY